MRMDLFLSRCYLIARRAVAKKACENGIVYVDGERAKPSKEVHAGQRVTVKFRDRHLEVEVLELPVRRVPKAAAPALYRIVRDEQVEV